MSKKILRNLQFGVSLSLLILIATSILSYISIQRQIEFRDNVAKSRKSIILVKDILISLLDAEIGNKAYQLTGNENFLEHYNKSQINFSIALEKINKIHITDANQKKLLIGLEDNVTKSMSNLKLYVNNRKKGVVMSQKEFSENKIFTDRSRDLATNFVKNEVSKLEWLNNDLDKASSTTTFLIVLSAISAVIVTGFFYIKLRSDLVRREKLESDLRNKDLEISKRVNAIQKIANKVANGDYSQTLKDDSQDDLGDLAESLNHMKESLKLSFEKINKNDWRQKGLVLLNDELVGNKALNELAQASLRQLIEYCNCINGSLYLYEDAKLKLKASFGLETNMKDQFLPGEGVIGQAFINQKEQIYNNLVDDDFVVSFSSGQLKIKGLLILPILFANQTIGVIELASKENFAEENIDFYLECSQNIGIALNAAKGREKEQQLLEETQAQSEELQSQHSELEHLNTELEAQTQKLQASEEELKVQQEELMQANAELEERSRLLEEKNNLIAERNIEIQKKVEELALSTKYKSEFLANMSHELRTPLNSILLLSRLMADNTDENLTEDQIESAKVIQSSGTSLLTLIDEILDLAKIESGKMTLEYSEIEISEIVRDLKNLFNPIFYEKNLQFIIDVDQDVQKTIESDRLRIEQVLRNLLANALKFTSKGSITLKIKKDSKKDDFIILSVKDTGIGIAEDKQKIIFEAFQQEDGSTRRKFGGTGLGLSISREIARLLGGKLVLKSKVNEGSEFSLIIPVKKNEDIDENSSSQDIVDHSNEILTIENTALENSNVNYSNSLKNLNVPDNIEDDRNQINEKDKVILIIEDDIAFAKALYKFANKQNYKAVIEVRGDYGVDAAKKYKPVAILLDVQLPIKDGWQVMDELKADYATKNIPVHMMSANHVKKESLMKGAIDFINKPVALDQMTNVFQKIEEAIKMSPQKVLIVEENPKHAIALSYFLSNFSISLSVEDNFQDCINALTEDQFDCVILTIDFTHENRYEMIEKIKTHEGLENLPIIIFTQRNLSQSEELKVRKFADSIVIKSAHSYQRILDEVGLFLHLVEEKSNDIDVVRNKTLGSLTEVLSGKKILITDDDVRNIFSLTKALEQYKVEVIVAMDGKQALQKIKENPNIDVVLMDMMMPEMDGYETIKEIRKINKFAKLPIIAITAKAMVGDRQKCIDAGASDYISKPVDIDQLLSLLRVWLYQN